MSFSTSRANEAHQHFSSNCFNLCWNVIEQTDPSEADNEQMLMLAYTSAWHWTQRSDKEPRHLSIAYWQLSRVHAMLNQGQMALYFAQRCIAVSQEAELDDFCKGYAHEAMARAMVTESETFAPAPGAIQEHIDAARSHAEKAEDPDDRHLLVSDLDQLVTLV
ncbi:MAG: hypothetical protein OSB41_06425 [Kiritimatiellae bacterium]|nr:hypothetical protein [Kiritimatiellia bacterium]